ncbi:MAG: GDSL-type esterase/lipase family protein [Bacteroidales bacterium]|jgi:hypothetical protein
MKKQYFLCVILILLFYDVSFSQSNPSVHFISGTTPVGFESEINDFLRHDSISIPPSGEFLFTGSSTIRKWENLAADFKEISVIQRGFGGSTMNALNYYINNIVLPYKPSTIIVYEGDNDLVEGLSPTEFVCLCDTFIKEVHREFPKTMIYFMSIKPSFARIQYLSTQNETNKLLQQLTKKRRKTGFIDIRQLMYNNDGKLRKDFFESDSLHVNAECYRVWADYMKRKLGIIK